VFFDTIIEAKEFDTTVHIQSEGRKQDGGGTAKCSTAQDFTCGVGGKKGLVITGVEAAHSLGDELLLDGGVPEVLHLVVRSTRQVLGDLGPPVVQWHTHAFSYLLHFPFAWPFLCPKQVNACITRIWAVACTDKGTASCREKAAGSHVCVADLRVACRIDYLFPSTLWSSTMRASSFCEKLPLLRSGLR